MKALFLIMMAIPIFANANSITQFSGTLDMNAVDVSGLLDFPSINPVWGLIAAGGNPNQDTVIPLNFNLGTGDVFDVRATTLTVTENTPETGGGYILQTPVGFGLIPTPYFEPVYYDQVDWHIADKSGVTGENAVSFLFDQHQELSPGVLGVDGVGGQAGIVFSDAAVSPVPIPASAWLLGSGLIGMIGIGRRKKA